LKINLLGKTSISSLVSIGRFSPSKIEITKFIGLAGATSIVIYTETASSAVASFTSPI